MNRSRNNGPSSRRPTRFLFAVMAAALLPLTAGAAGTNVSSAANSVPSYRFIAQRNIFNPNRYAGSGEGRLLNPQRVATAPGFALVGTMLYERGAFAFFDGTDSQYKKVLQAPGVIADYRVAEVTSGYVKLQGATSLSTNQIVLPIGMQLKKLGEGDWQLVAGAEFASGSSGSSYRRNRNDRTSEGSSSASASETSAAADKGISSGTGGSASDVLKRLMEQREKELQK
jgi:hypothetical protein